MKKILTTIIFACISLIGFGTSWTITFSGTTFTPDSITVNSIDTIVFNLSVNHDAAEVTQTTWNANGSTASGGFNVNFGGGTVLANTLATGVHYYVCQAHVAQFHMKGRIYVVNTTGIPSVNDNKPAFNIYPNPVSGVLSVNYSLAGKANVSIKIYNVMGQNSMTLLSETKDLGSFYSSFELERNNLPKGIYIMELMIGDSKNTKRFIIE
jgi:plastocyanin